MTTILLSILKVLGTSFLAIFAVGLVFLVIRFPPIKTWFDYFLTKNKKVVYAVPVLLILGMPIMFVMITGEELFPVFLVYIRELLLSVIIVFIFWITWALTENPVEAKRAFFTAFLRTLLNVERKNYFGTGWRTLSLDEKILDFLATEYPHLKKILSEPTFKNYLNICQIGIGHQLIEHEFKLYDLNNPNDYRYIPLEDTAMIIPLETAIKGLQNYNVNSEFNAIRNLLNIDV